MWRRLSSRLTQMSVDQFFHELNAFELHKLHISFDPAVQRHADLPRPREDLLILDSRLVVQAIGTGCRDAFDDVQFITMVIADTVEPALIIEAGRIDDERFAFPMPIRPAHPAIGGSLCRLSHVDGSNRAGVFENHHHDIFALDDLKREGHVHGARDARKIAFDLRIERQPLLIVFFLLRGCSRKVRDFASFDPADSRRHRVLGPESDHTSEIRRMRLKIPVGFIQRLPDAVKIRPSIRCPRSAISLGLSRSRSGSLGHQYCDSYGHSGNYQKCFKHNTHYSNSYVPISPVSEHPQPRSFRLRSGCSPRRNIRTTLDPFACGRTPGCF